MPHSDARAYSYFSEMARTQPELNLSVVRLPRLLTPEYSAHPGLPARQWDDPNGWAPHQMLAWRALLQNGFDTEAARLIHRWLYTIARNAADYNGTVPEKFDVVERSHRVFAEYGNVGTTFS